MTKLLSLFLFFLPLSATINLSDDQTLKQIFDVVGTTNSFAVEVIEKEPLVEELGFGSLSFGKEMVMKENIKELLMKHHAPKIFDLLSVNGYNAFYLWLGIDEPFAPRVVVIDFNPTISANRDRVAIYKPLHRNDGTSYFGASILSLYKLGELKGYTLVYATESKLFFVQNQLLGKKKFKNQNDPTKLYRRSDKKYKLDVLARSYITYNQALKQRSTIRIEK